MFLLSLKAAGTGLNLTRADHVVHYDRWWNPAVEDQATDRAYRIGQTRPVQVHRLIAEGTIEDRIAAMLEQQTRSWPMPCWPAGEAGADRVVRRRTGRAGRAAGWRDDRGARDSRPFPRRRGRRSTRGRSWWAQAWVQALEDTSLDSDQLRKGRRYANSGQVGTITDQPGADRGDGVLARRRLRSGRAGRARSTMTSGAGSWTRSRPAPGTSPRCSTARCRTTWSRPPPMRAFRCCRGSATSTRAAPVTPGNSPASTPPASATRSAGCSTPTRSCCCCCAAARVRTLLDRAPEPAQPRPRRPALPRRGSRRPRLSQLPVGALPERRAAAGLRDARTSSRSDGGIEHAVNGTPEQPLSRCSCSTPHAGHGRSSTHCFTACRSPGSLDEWQDSRTPRR